MKSPTFMNSGIHVHGSAIRKMVLFIYVVLFSVLAAGDTITFREEVYVKGPRVLLGDLADIEGDLAVELAAIEIVTAALPGNTKRVDAALAVSRLRGAGIDTSLLKVEGPRRISATTLHLEITPGMLAEDLRNFISLEMPWDLEQTVLDIRPPGKTFNVSDGTVEIRWKSNPQYRYLGSGAFRGEVLVDGRVEKSFYVRADIKTYADVAVAAGGVRRGDFFTASNVRMEKKELSTLGRGAFFAIEDLSSYVARSSMGEGQLITHRKVVAPQLVKRNQLVTVETRIGALFIRSQARAMSSGVAGDALLCESLDSEEQFMGVLQKDGVVVVH